MPFDSDLLVNKIGSLVTAIGGLGLASAALVDATKALPGGGVSTVGFTRIEHCMRMFMPKLPKRDGKTSLTTSILPILHANWINGMTLSDQRDIARSLIKMKLSVDNAEHMATVAEVDGKALKTAISQQASAGAALTDEQKNALGRFDLALASILDATYQEASQRYRNVSKLCSGIVAIVMSLAGACVLAGGTIQGAQLGAALFCGLLAVPLAPVAKDLTSALSAGVKAVQTARRVL